MMMTMAIKTGALDMADSPLDHGEPTSGLLSVTRTLWRLSLDNGARSGRTPALAAAIRSNSVLQRPLTLVASAAHVRCLGRRQRASTAARHLCATAPGRG